MSYTTICGYFPKSTCVIWHMVCCDRSKVEVNLMHCNLYRNDNINNCKSVNRYRYLKHWTKYNKTKHKQVNTDCMWMSKQSTVQKYKFIAWWRNISWHSTTWFQPAELRELALGEIHFRMLFHKPGTQEAYFADNCKNYRNMCKLTPTWNNSPKWLGITILHFILN